jgi:nucleotide-binding universal stress UspA family protein
MTRFGNILFVADADSWSPQAYDRAVKLALRDNARLTVLDIIEELPHPLAFGGNNIAVDVWSTAILERTERLKQLAVKAFDVRSVEIHVACGNWLDEAIHEVVRNGHDLLIVTERPSDASRGASAVRLVRKCPCAVWLIRDDSRHPYARVMAAVDPDPYNADRDALNTRIMRTAASIARRERSELHIAHAWMPFGESLLRGRGGVSPNVVEKYVDNLLAERTEAIDSLLKKSKVRASKRRMHLLKGPAVKAIPETVALKKADLLVVGTLNRSGLARWFLANTAEQVLRRVSCDVLVVKPDRVVNWERLKPRSVKPAGFASPRRNLRKETFVQ